MYGLNLRKDKIKLCASHGIRTVTTVSVTKYTSAQRKTFNLTCYSIYNLSSWDLFEVGLYHEHLNHFN
jgi:hypothetical protein